MIYRSPGFFNRYALDSCQRKCAVEYDNYSESNETASLRPETIS